MCAVAQDVPEPTPLAEVARHTGKSPSWVNKYRASLIKERVIESQGYGLIRLTTPHLAEYIREQGRQAVGEVLN